jgi:branched-chain amino acid aminotransferase
MTEQTPVTAIPIGILTPGGLQPAPYTAGSLAEAANFEPPGVYTVGRTFKRTHTLLFDEHVARLEESARLENIPLRLDRKALRRAMRLLVDRSGFEESRFRITIPRDTPETAIISLEAFIQPPPELIEQGVRVVTVRLARHNPAAKSTAWMNERKAARDAFAPGVYEGILVSEDGRLLEGLSSNFYAIADGAIYTAGEGVLRGMAQRVVMQVAPQVAPITWQAPRADQLWALDEAFLTSASRGIVPIVIIDHQIIATGHPGSITLRLRDAYDAWAEAHLEALE